MTWNQDLAAGSGLAFSGAMVEAIGGMATMTAATAAALSTLGGVFLVLGPIIVGFGLYERFFLSNLVATS